MAERSRILLARVASNICVLQIQIRPECASGASSLISESMNVTKQWRTYRERRERHLFSQCVKLLHFNRDDQGLIVLLEVQSAESTKRSAPDGGRKEACKKNNVEACR